MQKAEYVIIFLAMFLLSIVLFFNTKTDNTQEIVTKSDIISSEEVKVESAPEENVVSSGCDSISSEEKHPQQVPSNVGKFKSYTNYQLLSKDSKQWEKIQCNENAYTDPNGLRKVDEYYCVAMGSYYAKNLGDLFEIQTEGGSFKVIICDFKADRHTDINNQYTFANGCMVEFYVDMRMLDETAEQMGDISYVNEEFYGEIISINRLGNYFDTGGVE